MTLLYFYIQTISAKHVQWGYIAGGYTRKYLFFLFCIFDIQTFSKIVSHSFFQPNTKNIKNYFRQKETIQQYLCFSF